MLIRSTLAAAALTLLAFLIWPELEERSQAIAFDDVARRLGQVQSVAYEIREERDGLPTRSTTVMVRGDGFERSEGSVGFTSIRNRAEQCAIELWPDRRRAIVNYPLTWDSDVSLNAIEKIRKLPETADAVAIESREIQGRSCPGFEFHREQNSLRERHQVWIDPVTRLPILVVITRSGRMAPVERLRSLGPEGVMTPMDELVESVETSTWSNFQFDVPLDEGLFQLQVPNGYAVEQWGTPPADRRPIADERLTIKPGIGIGDAVFGMTKAEVIAILGEPEVIERKSWTVEDLNAMRARYDGRELEVTGEREWEILKYNSRGFWITVRPVAGFREVQCWGFDDHLSFAAIFPGRTEKGIGIGSTAEELIAAYGPPVVGSWRDIEWGSVLYQRGGMGDTFSVQTRNGRIANIIMQSLEGAITYH